MEANQPLGTCLQGSGRTPTTPHWSRPPAVNQLFSLKAAHQLLCVPSSAQQGAPPPEEALSTSHPCHQYPRELLYHMSLCQLESIPPHGPEMTGPTYHLISGAERRRCTKLCVFCKAQVAHPIPAAAGLFMLPHVTLGPLWLLQ